MRLRCAMALAAVLFAGSACGASAPADSAPRRASTPTWEAGTAADPQMVALLRALGAEKLYVMAGEQASRAGLGVVSSSGLAPFSVTPIQPVISSISGNGNQVVIGGAVPKGGFLLNGVYRLEGDHLVTLSRPGSFREAPTVSRTGKVAVLQGQGAGFELLSPGATTWVREPRLQVRGLSPLSWLPGGGAVAIVHPNESPARLVELTRSGRTSRWGRAYCASLPIAAPGRRLAALTLPIGHRKHGACASRRVRVVGSAGLVAQAPAGWNLLGWSADSQKLLLVDGTTLGVWNVRTRTFVAQATTDVPVWMAAPIYR